MKNILLLILIFISVVAYSQKEAAVYKMPNATTQFGRALPDGKLIQDTTTKKLYQLRQYANSTETLNTVLKAEVNDDGATVTQTDVNQLGDSLRTEMEDSLQDNRLWALATFLQTFTEADPVWISDSNQYYPKAFVQALLALKQSFADTTLWDATRSYVRQGDRDTAQDTRTWALATFLQSFTEVDPVWIGDSADYYPKVFVQSLLALNQSIQDTGTWDASRWYVDSLISTLSFGGVSQTDVNQAVDSVRAELADSTHLRKHGMSSTADHYATNWRMFYSNGSGNVNELAFGTSGKVLQTNGTSAAPTWETPSGGIGGSIADGQIAYGNGTDITGNNLFKINTANFAIETEDNAVRQNILIGKGISGVISGGNFNTSVGRFSARLLTSGDNNVMLGNAAGYNLTTGGQNLYLGSLAGFSAGNESNRLRISTSNAATSAEVNLIYGEFDNKKVGINTQTAPSTLTVRAATATSPLLLENNVGTDLFSVGVAADFGTGTLGSGAFYWKESTQQLTIGSTLGTLTGTFNSIASNNNRTSKSIVGLDSDRDENFVVWDDGAITGTAMLIDANAAPYNTLIGRAHETAATGTRNVAIGSATMQNLTTGANNVAVGTLAGENVLTSSNSVYIGAMAGTGSNTSDRLYISNSNTGLTVEKRLIYGEFDNGRVGINQGSASYTLDVNGDVNATGYRAGGTAGITQTVPVYNDGTSGNLTQITITNGIITAVTTAP